MADMTTDIELDVDEPELSEYTTESQTIPAGAPVRKPTASAPGGATGRRTRPRRTGTSPPPRPR